MNKTKIEWCDYTWSPVRGCLHACPYCYARRIDKRFGDGSFTPTFHPKRLIEPLAVKKPSRIFVGSMADLFGDWMWDVYENGDEEGFASGLVSREHVVNRVLNVAKQCPQHTFIFLTKNPKGMQGFNFPDNCWCGTSVENQEKADEKIYELQKVECNTLFIGYEPALGPIRFDQINTDCKAITMDCFTGIPYDWDYGEKQPEDKINPIKWLIIGAQTGPGAVKPKAEWIAMAVYQAKQAGIPVFIKDNIGPDMAIWPMLREFPI